MQPFYASIPASCGGCPRIVCSGDLWQHGIIPKFRVEASTRGRVGCMMSAGGISPPPSGRRFANAKSLLARREEGGIFPEVALFGLPTFAQPRNQVDKEGDLGGGGLRGLSLRDRPSRHSLDLTPSPSPSPQRHARLSLNRAKERGTGLEFLLVRRSSCLAG
jgi:hypothetical protein